MIYRKRLEFNLLGLLYILTIWSTKIVSDLSLENYNKAIIPCMSKKNLNLNLISLIEEECKA